MSLCTTAARCALSLALFAGLGATSFAQTMTHVPMATADGAAKVVAMSGQVSLLRDGEPWALHVNDYVQPMQVIVTGDNGSAMFKVSDGSTFEVFPNSKVYFRATRGNWDDLLELILGKIKVQIEHLGGVPNGNKVRTPTAVISVRGTTFDVEYDPDRESTTVTDEDGSVDVARATNRDDHKLLHANESIVVYKNERLGKSGIDKGNLAKRIVQSAMDALTQEAINARTSAPAAGSVGSGGGPVATPPPTSGSGDKNNSPTPAPPAPPPPPPPPAH
ncbi:MAG TPA: FecR domain-containing protein [Bryobacteraceae bacterium]|nr:FecR domain-containing protein [Bryobacteraceae bacterium]